MNVNTKYRILASIRQCYDVLRLSSGFVPHFMPQRRSAPKWASDELQRACEEGPSKNFRDLLSHFCAAYEALPAAMQTHTCFSRVYNDILYAPEQTLSIICQGFENAKRNKQFPRFGDMGDGNTTPEEAEAKRLLFRGAFSHFAGPDSTRWPEAPTDGTGVRLPGTPLWKFSRRDWIVLGFVVTMIAVGMLVHTFTHQWTDKFFRRARSL